MRNNRVRQERTAAGLSQVQLSFLSGVASNVISDVELGKREAWPKARKALARALKVAESELFPTKERDGNR